MIKVISAIACPQPWPQVVGAGFIEPTIGIPLAELRGKSYGFPVRPWRQIMEQQYIKP